MRFNSNKRKQTCEAISTASKRSCISSHDLGDNNPLTPVSDEGEADDTDSHQSANEATVVSASRTPSNEIRACAMTNGRSSRPESFTIFAEVISR